MTTLPLYRAAVGAVLALALTAAPAVASITDGTSNTLSATAAPNTLSAANASGTAGEPTALSLNFAKITEFKAPFQGGCSKTTDCLMESEGIGYD